MKLLINFAAALFATVTIFSAAMFLLLIAAGIGTYIR